MKKIAIITGAGISAESGISTFRDSNGLWEKHSIDDVASYGGWLNNPQLVLDFYNQQRRQLEHCRPNAAHIGLAGLEKNFEVHIITQNIDNLHERAGSNRILHLHGELTKACNEYRNVVKEIGYSDIKMGDEIGHTQMRPFVIWFGEPVPAFEEAINIIRQADIVAVIGTSLKVYPAADLINYVPENVPVYFIDPNKVPTSRKVHFINKKATEGVKELIEILNNHHLKM